MAEDKKKKPEGDFNIFIANSIFPDATSIFSHRLNSLEHVKNDSLIILDTNALLVPYNIGKESLEQIQKTYHGLAKSKRLIVPGQVAREFAKNRANKLTELFQQLSRKMSSIQKLQRGRYPLLESLTEYKEVTRLESEIDKLLTDYRNYLNQVIDHIRSWTWNDPVSAMYSDIFNENVVFDLPIEKEKILEDLNNRQIHSIPPGYKDAGKEDSGIGDLLIWQTILTIAQTHKKDVIFVSGDEKADWWHRSEQQALYPRYELIDEFRRASDGKSFHIIQFSRFLDLFGASESVVQEVRQEERLSRTESTPLRRQSIYGPRDEGLLGQADDIVLKWLSLNNPQKKISRDPQRLRELSREGVPYVDAIMVDADEKTTAIDVIRFRANLGPMSRTRIRERGHIGYYAVNEGHVDRYLVVAVCEDEETASLVLRSIGRDAIRAEDVNYIIGYLSSEGDFQEVSGGSDQIQMSLLS